MLIERTLGFLMMPVDVRKLIFTKQELIVAFQMYAKNKKLGAPASSVKDVKILENAMPAPGHLGSVKKTKGLTATLQYAALAPNTPIRLNLAEDQMLEALVIMCHELKIPLPKRGQKLLHIHQDALALTIALNEDDIRSARTAAKV